MNKNRIAILLTLALLAAILAFTLRRRQATPPAAPQDTIYAMLDAARAGDPKRYLSFYTGQMEANLRQAIKERTESGFRDYLVTSHGAIKGVAVMEPKPVSDREVEVRVEYVYQDRNEAQTTYLEKRGESWKIARVDGAERVRTLIPYGTPVQ